MAEAIIPPDIASPNRPSRANLELKARLTDTDRAIRIALESLGAQDTGTLTQVDTYFRISEGRLKLREISEEAGTASCELIFYNRPEADPVRRSLYDIVEVADPVAMKRVLGLALPVRGVVKKRRRLFIWNRCRIHVDEVENLGSFIEFEVCSIGDLGDDDRRMTALKCAFGIDDADTISASYSDLLGL